MVNTKEGLLYTDVHMWIRKEGDNVRIGLTDFGQTDLGEVVFVDLPESGSEINKGDEFGALESVKTIESLFSPVSGKILGSNTVLPGKPDKINTSPYDEGWLILIETDGSELDGFMDESGYKEFCSKF